MDLDAKDFVEPTSVRLIRRTDAVNDTPLIVVFDKKKRLGWWGKERQHVLTDILLQILAVTQPSK